MADNSEIFDEIVDPAVKQQLQDTATGLAALDAAFIKAAQSANSFNEATSNSKTPAQFKANSEASNAATQNIIDNNEKTRLSEIKLQQAREKAFDDYEKKIAKQIADQAKLDAATAKSLQPIEQLKKAYADSRVETENLAASQGRLSKAYLESNEKTKGLKTELDTIRSAYGDATGSVGKYEKAFSGLSKVYGLVRQAAYILPGIGIAGIFNDAFQVLVILADKLGIFTKKVQEAKTALDEAINSANKTGADELTKLDVLYDAATNLNIPFAERLRAVKELQKEYPAYFGNLSQEAILAGKAATAYDNLSNSIINQAVLKAAEQPLQEAIKPLVDIISFQKKTQAEFDKNEDERIERDKKRQAAVNQPGFRRPATNTPGFRAVTPGTIRQGFNNPGVDDESSAAIAAGTNGTKTLDAYKKTLTDKIKDVRESIQQVIKELGINSLLDPDKIDKPKKGKTVKSDLDERLKIIRDNEELILKAENSTYQQRIDAITKFYEQSNALIDKYEKKKKITPGAANSLRSGISVDQLTQTQDAQNKLSELLKKELADIFNQDKDNAEKTVDTLNEINARYLDNLQKSRQNDVDDVNDLYAKGIISKQKYQDILLKIEDKYNIDRLKKQLDTDQAILVASKAALNNAIADNEGNSDNVPAELKTAVDTAANKVKTDKTDLSNATQKQTIDNTDSAKAKAIKFANDIGDAVGNAQQLQMDGSKLIQSEYESEIELLQKKSNLINENAKAEIDGVNNSILSEKDKQNRINIINAQTAAQQQQIQSKINKEKTKAAQAEKIANIASILENIEVAESKAIAQGGALFGIPFTAIVAALGAAQLATAIAVKVPQYRMGTNNAKGGLSIVGEDGFELVTEKTGKSYFTPNNASFMNIPAGAKIIPHKDLMGAINMNFNTDKSFSKEILYQLKKMDKPHQRIPQTKVIINDSFSRMQYLRR